MTNAALGEAIAALRANDRQTARTLLAQLREQQSNAIETWLWSAAASDDSSEKCTFLKQALVIEPHNERAQAALLAAGGGTIKSAPPSVAEAVPQQRVVPHKRFAAPRLRATGAKTRRSVPWTLIALALIVIALIPLTLWLI